MTESIVPLLPFVICSIITNVATARSDRNRADAQHRDTRLVADEAAEFERILTLTKHHLTDVVGLLNAATAKITNVPLKLIN